MHPLPSVVRRHGETKSSTGWVVDEKRDGAERARDGGEVSGDNGMDRGPTVATARKGEMKKTARGLPMTQTRIHFDVGSG